MKITWKGKNHFVESLNDVIACVKRYAADENLSQELLSDLE